MSDQGPMIIDLGIDDGQLGAMDDVVSALKTITDEWRDMVQALRDATTGIGQFATTARAARAIVPAGPMSRFTTAQNNLAKARAGGDPSQIFDAQFRVLQTQNSLQRAQNQLSGNTMPAWAQAIMSSRFSIGGSGGVQPLVGRSLAALGKSAGAAGVALAGAAVGVGAFVAALGVARGVLGGMRKGYYASGGSSSFGGLAGIGAAIGMDPAQMGQMSEAFGQRLLSDPMAQMSARRAGIDVFAAHPLFGSQDTGRQMMQAIDYIRRVSEKEAIRFARTTGTEDALGLRDVSAATFKDAKAMFESLASPEFRKSSAEFEAQLGILGGEFQKFLVEVIGPMLPSLAGLVRVGREFAKVLQLQFKVLQWIGDKFKSLFDWVANLWGNNMPSGMVPGANGRPGLVPGRDMEDLYRANTNALDRNSRAIESLTRQIFGGGDRARRAIPQGWAHHSIQDAARGAAINLGAFGI